jgi:GNAT superfamily N-acetyltransferase
MSLLAHKVAVRTATIADREALRAMQALSISVLGVDYYSPEQIAAFICKIGTLDDLLLHEGTYYVAETEGEIVASGGWSRRTPNYANATSRADRAKMAPHLPKARSVYVHPAFARRGLATRLMARAEGEATAAGYEAMEVSATLSGVPFYLKRGYRPINQVALCLPGNIPFAGVHMVKVPARCRQCSPETSAVAAPRLGLRRDLAPAPVEQHAERILADSCNARENDGIVAIVVRDVKDLRVSLKQHVALIDAADMDDEGVAVLMQAREELLLHAKSRGAVGRSFLDAGKRQDEAARLLVGHLG